MAVSSKISFGRKSRAIFDPMITPEVEQCTPSDFNRFDMVRKRLYVLMMLIITGYVFLVLKLFYIAVMSSQPQSISAPVAFKKRAEIVDRNGEVLATQVPMATLIANPSKVIDPEGAALELAKIFPDMDIKDVYEKLTQNDKRYTVLRRDISPKEQQLIHDLGFPSLGFEYNEKRFYPEGNLFSHALGYVTLDNKGQAGAELSLNDMLTKAPEPALDGTTEQKPIMLSLDKRTQYIVHDVLEKGMQDFKADGISALVMDTRTGEIVSMVSLPDFDPNNRGAWEYGTTQDGQKEIDDRYGNRVTLGTYEMGSTFKIFNTAIALETGVIKMTDNIDVTGPLYYRGHTIKDFHAHRGAMSIADIFRKSSNIGSVRMADRFGVSVQQEYMRRFGMLDRPKLELKEVSSPQIPRQWGYVEMMTISYGYGLSVSPLQLVAGVASVVNGGTLVSPTLLLKNSAQKAEEEKRSLDASALPPVTPTPVGESNSSDKAHRPVTKTALLPREMPLVGTRILSEKTSDQMRYLMRLVVEKGGTGTKADVEGYPVIGKTGTANKARQGHKGYDGASCVSSFVGAFPYQKPEYAILVSVDTPKLEQFVTRCPTGGLVAAPLVGEIVSRIAPLLNVQPVARDRNLFLEPVKSASDEILSQDNPAFLEEDSIR